MEKGNEQLRRRKVNNVSAKSEESLERSKKTTWVRENSSLQDDSDEDGYPEIALMQLTKENTLIDIEQQSLDGTLRQGP